MKKWMGWRKTAGRLALAGALACGGWMAAVRWAPFPDSAYAPRASAWLLTDRAGQVLRVRRAADDRVAFAGTAEGWGLVGQAVIAAEDKRFFRHGGVDFLALARAIGQNVFRRRVHSGASTISTQVVRLREPSGRRHLGVKLFEAFRAMQLERRRTKAEILALYLDHAPFGGPLEGVRAAARAYFDREPDDLSAAEAALLAGLPNAPSRLRPDRYPGRARARRDTVLRRMHGLGFITQAELARALAEPVVCRRGGRAFRAPHFCDWALARLPAGGEWRTTLDGRIQEMAEAALTAQAARWRARGVYGGAVVVVETKTGAIRALVGSPDFLDSRHAGQVNGAAAVRSPGSALKPFLYLAAFDRGLAGPADGLPDVPVSYRGYRPVNFDGAWSGWVSARRALALSLNVPALKLAERLGLPAFLESAALAGVPLRERAGGFGLGVVMGDGETTLLDLARGYATLARLGVAGPLRFLEDAPPEPGARVCSAGAAFLVADILSGDMRQMAFYGSRVEARVPLVAWKTGTSSGYRDAWCAAYNPEYVVAVWMGNPDGRGAPGLTGAEAAAPLAAELFRRLYPSGDGPWFEPPAGAVRRPVCALSGRPPNADCPVTIEEWVLAGVTDPAPCRLHRRVPFDRASGRRVSLEEAGAGTVEWRVAVEWPAEVADWWRRQGSGAGLRGDAVRIEAPVAGRVYRRVEAGAAWGGRGLPLRAAGGDGSGLYWFLDGAYIGQSGLGRELRLPWPAPGERTVMCMDPSGRGDTVSFRVE